MIFQTFRYVNETTVVPPFCEDDEPTTTTHIYRREGSRILAGDRANALEQVRALYGRDAAGVEAVGVDCTFCEDRPVPNAARRLDPSAPEHAPCLRCGK